MCELIPSEDFFHRRFRKAGKLELRAFILATGKWQYGDAVLNTRNHLQLICILRELLLGPKADEGVDFKPERQPPAGAAHQPG